MLEAGRSTARPVLPAQQDDRMPDSPPLNGNHTTGANTQPESAPEATPDPPGIPHERCRLPSPSSAPASAAAGPSATHEERATHPASQQSNSAAPSTGVHHQNFPCATLPFDELQKQEHQYQVYPLQFLRLRPLNTTESTDGCTTQLPAPKPPRGAIEQELVAPLVHHVTAGSAATADGAVVADGVTFTPGASKEEIEAALKTLLLSAINVCTHFTLRHYGQVWILCTNQGANGFLMVYKNMRRVWSHK